MKHFQDYIDEQRIFRVEDMDITTRHRIISTTVMFILDEVINYRIGKNENYIKHCIEFSYEYRETANVLDILYVFRKILINLIEDQSDHLFQLILKLITEGDDKNDN